MISKWCLDIVKATIQNNNNNNNDTYRKKNTDMYKFIMLANGLRAI